MAKNNSERSLNFLIKFDLAVISFGFKSKRNFPLYQDILKVKEKNPKELRFCKKFEALVFPNTYICCLTNTLLCNAGYFF